MKKNMFQIFCVGILCLMTSTVGLAQDRTLSSAAGDLYVISAKAGGVNYVEGRVSVQRNDGNSGYLVKGDILEADEKVSTSQNSRAEVLMNPGSFVRLNENSEFEFSTTSLNDLKLQVNRGSAIFEVYASDDFKVTVTTPKAKFYLIRTGVYRVEVIGDGIGKIEVYKGKAQIGNFAADTVEKGRTATVNGDDVAIEKYDRGDMDSFEEWSKSRAKLIAKANKKLTHDKLSNSLLSGNRVDCYSSMGLWVLNSRYNSYSFLPYGYGWRSPYGYGLGTSTGICNDPYSSYYWGRPRYRNPRNTGGNGGGTTPTTTVPAANIARGSRNTTPPFRRMENSGNSNPNQSARSSRNSRRSSFPDFPTSGGTGRRGSSKRSTPAPTQSAPRRSAPSRPAPSRPPLSSPKGRN